MPLGVLAAWRFGGWLDRGLMAFSVLGFSIPIFVLAYLLIWTVSLQLGWLPVLIATVGLLVYRNDLVRRSVGVVWDVGTFWPRTAHPLAPPSYAERAVPELQTRTAGLLGQLAEERRHPIGMAVYREVDGHAVYERPDEQED